MNETIKTLHDIPRNCRLYIYCAGVFGRQLLRVLRQERHDVQLLGFIDTFKTGVIDGLPIVPLEQLEPDGNDFDLILVAIQPEIKAQISKLLMEQGYSSFCHLDQNFRLSSDDSGDDEDRIKDVLYAFYDFDVSPASFAFLMFLYLAETERVGKGYKYLQPVLVPRSRNRLSLVMGNETTGRLEEGDTDAWFIQNVMTSCCWLLPSCRQLTICNSRQEAAFIARELAINKFPQDYTIEAPEEHYSHFKICQAIAAGPQVSLHSPAKARQYIQQWMTSRNIRQKIVTMTLRETFADIKRNSQIAEWVKFARSLDPRDYHPVFIRDTNASLSADLPELEGFTVFFEAPWNLELRMALYEAAYLNMFVNNGPAALCSLNARTRYLTFVYLSEEQFSCSRAYYESAGVEVGAQFPGASPFQRTVWQGRDSSENLQKEFQAMCTLIETERETEALCG